MKTKLYRKVIRMSWRQLCSDFRPSSHDLIAKAVSPHCLSGSLKVNVLPRSVQDARAAFIVWTEKVSNGDLRYDLKDYIEKKFKKRSRKWWMSSSKLKRAVNDGRI